MAPGCRTLACALLALSATLPLAGCGTMVIAAAAGADSLSQMTADKNCSQVPKFVPPPSVDIHSILLGSYEDHDHARDYSLMPLNVLGRIKGNEYVVTNEYAMFAHVLNNGLRFIEIESPGAESKAMREFVDMGGDRQMKYLRVSLASRGDPACGGFERAVKAMGTEMFQNQLLGAVPPSTCIAAYPEALAASDYELRVVDLPDDRLFKRQFSEQPALWQIVDLRTNAVYAQMQRRMDIYPCPFVEVRDQFLDVLRIEPRLPSE
jgi:hypothetical protein